MKYQVIFNLTCQLVQYSHRPPHHLDDYLIENC